MNPSIYSVRRTGNLFIVKASIGRFNAPPSVLELLIDTGATHTSLPIEFLKDIGCSIYSQTPRKSILTGHLALLILRLHKSPGSRLAS